MRLYKKSLLNILDTYFVPRGYKFNPEEGQGYFKESEICSVKLSFNFKTRSNGHINSTILIHIKSVEKILKEIGSPNRNKEYDLVNDVQLITLQDKDNSRSLAEERMKIDLSKEKGYIEWAHLIIKYMRESGEVFLDKYCHLPNVLKRLNQLEDEGEVSYTKIMVGGLDHLFRVLVISKLCDDSRYTSKIERFDEIFSRDAYEDWVPYYNDLKSKLETIDPIYTNM